MKIATFLLFATLALAAIGYSQAQDKQVQDLRRLVIGIRYDTVLGCIVIKGSRSSNGCNEKELNGGNWVTYHVPSASWVFSEDGTVSLYTLVGSPDERAGKIRWTCGKSEKDGGQPAWVRISGDGMHVLYSCNRPPDDADFKPQVRYDYFSLGVGQ